MKHFYFCTLLALTLFKAYAQELYVFTEPASNMPSKSVSLKLSGRFPDSKYDNKFRQRYTPELMFGINKNWMVHVSSSFSNYYFNNIRLDGAKLYAKYRFLSKDDVHRHFRLAGFAEAGYTRNPYIYEDVSLEGDNDGAQVGLIATQLVNKLAISATTSYTRAFAEKLEHQDHLGHSLYMFNYSLSAGYLVFPKEYIGYKQTNLNLYLEMLGAGGRGNDHYAIDIAPAIQVIFNSNTKVNVGYRVQLKSNMFRVGENMLQVGLERTILNAWK